ncbi:cation diffusion facilitator family transporter [Propioniciclava flava]|uniref:Cation-efflux pump n=1 Tax=Propioniciclava flava TaxID=2072026 RepID=A0A4Q2EJU3_9ACTN|nr:cation diffusion facilitator family transporter [Propioniciclava flava]RXW32972.1 cation-efflux pump [Propioniciclava flava]
MDTAQPDSPVSTRFLMKFILLSIAAAVLTVGIKGSAALMTGSVGLLSDALESTVNLVAAFVALWALAVSGKPADHNHDFGHGKAEYMSSLVEGALIFVAAASIIITSIRRFIVPEPVEEIGWGLILASLATVINLVVGLILIRKGRQNRSITLEADGKHLITDVWTTVGVIAGIVLLFLTGWQWIDPLIALLVGINILWTGGKLIRRSVVGLLDAALPDEEVALIHEALDVVTDTNVDVTQILTRESGRQRFVQTTVVVPGDWSVSRSHKLADRIEEVVDEALPGTTTVVHIEPGPESAPAPGVEQGPDAASASGDASGTEGTPAAR